MDFIVGVLGQASTRTSLTVYINQHRKYLNKPLRSSALLRLAAIGNCRGESFCFFSHACSYDPNNATDLWHVKKVNPQSMVMVDHYQRFTGQPAVLERTGESPIPM